METASQAGIPEGLRTTSKRALPRFGFAYKLTDDDKTVLRGGIGAYQASTLGSVYYSLTGTLQAYTNEYYNVETAGVGPAFIWPATSFGNAGDRAVRHPPTSARPTPSPGKNPIHSSGTFPWSATSGEEPGCVSLTSA